MLIVSPGSMSSIARVVALFVYHLHHADLDQADLGDLMLSDIFQSKSTYYILCIIFYYLLLYGKETFCFREEMADVDPANRGNFFIGYFHSGD